MHIFIKYIITILIQNQKELNISDKIKTIH